MVPATEGLAPEEDLGLAAKMGALATDPATPSSTFDVAGLENRSLGFWLRVPVSTLLSIAQGHFESLYIFYKSFYFVL